MTHTGLVTHTELATQVVYAVSALLSVRGGAYVDAIVKQVLTRSLGVVAALLLFEAACTNHWLDRTGDRYGLLGQWTEGGNWIWHTHWIEVARGMNEPIARSVTFVVAGIVTLVANVVASLALLTSAVRDVRWVRRAALVSVVLAVVSALVFLSTKPIESGILFSWSMNAFYVGIAAAIVRFRRA